VSNYGRTIGKQGGVTGPNSAFVLCVVVTGASKLAVYSTTGGKQCAWIYVGFGKYNNTHIHAVCTFCTRSSISETKRSCDCEREVSVLYEQTLC
jgi:hypothetical protein